MHALVHDVRDAVAAEQPRFLIIASLTLALGIGAVTAIFSVVNGVLLKPLPYPHADRLVNVWSTAPGLELRPVSAVAGSVPLLPEAQPGRSRTWRSSRAGAPT